MANDENITLNVITTKQEHKLYSELFVDSLMSIITLMEPIHNHLNGAS